LVGQRHDVGGDGALVGLLKTREREGTRLEKTRGGVGHGGRLMRMQRAAVVLGRAVLVSAAHVSAVWPLGVAAMSVPAGRKALVASSPQSAPRNGVEVLDEVLWRGCHLERGQELDLLGGIRRGVAGRKGSGGANCRPGMSAQDGGGRVGIPVGLVGLCGVARCLDAHFSKAWRRAGMPGLAKTESATWLTR
jgi:hypothetical protein